MSGKSTAVYSVEIGSAVTEGGSPDANLIPNPTADSVSFTGMATATGSVGAFSGSEGIVDEEQGRRTPGANRPTAVGVVAGATTFGANAGEFIRAMYPDSIEISHRFKGSNGLLPTSHGYGKILGSSMGLYDPASAGDSSIALASNSTDDGVLIVDDSEIGKFKLGAPVRMYTYDATGAANTFFHEYAFVTKIENTDGANSQITVHPKFSFTPQSGQTVQLCYAFFPVVGASNAALNDFHAKLSVGGVGTDATVGRLASGCRCTGFTISNDNAGASLSMTFKPLVMLTDDANANAVEVSENPGLLLQHRYGCRVDIGRDHDGVTGAASQIRGKSGAGNAGKPLPNFDHTIEVTFETAEGTPSTRGVLRGLTHEIHNATCNVSITTENDEELQKIITRDELRTLILGFGPGGTGADNPNGGAFILKNASRADGDANIEAGDGNRIQQNTNLMAVSDYSKFEGTPAAGAETQLATAPFILVLPKVG